MKRGIIITKEEKIKVLDAAIKDIESGVEIFACVAFASSVFRLFLFQDSSQNTWMYLYMRNEFKVFVIENVLYQHFPGTNFYWFSSKEERLNAMRLFLIHLKKQ